MVGIVLTYMVQHPVTTTSDTVGLADAIGVFYYLDVETSATVFRSSMVVFRSSMVL